MRESVSLGDIQETLLIPLYGRALDARRSSSVLNDSMAIDLVDRIDYDFSKFRGPSLTGSVLRASIFDEYVRSFLRIHRAGTVVDLGCGLSTRFSRLDNGDVRWFDLDVPDTMALRRKFFDETDRYTMISGSIFDTDWYDQVRDGSGPLFLLSEAVLLYFPDTQVHPLLTRMAKEFPGKSMAFDTAGPTMINSQDQNQVFKTVSARMEWTCSNPADLQQFGLQLQESRAFSNPQPDVARTWPVTYRYGFKLLRWLPLVKAYRFNLFLADGR